MEICVYYIWTVIIQPLLKIKQLSVLSTQPRFYLRALDKQNKTAGKHLDCEFIDVSNNIPTAQKAVSTPNASVKMVDKGQSAYYRFLQQICVAGMPRFPVGLVD